MHVHSAAVHAHKSNQNCVFLGEYARTYYYWLLLPMGMNLFHCNILCLSLSFFLSFWYVDTQYRSIVLKSDTKYGMCDFSRKISQKHFFIEYSILCAQPCICSMLKANKSVSMNNYDVSFIRNADPETSIFSNLLQRKSFM